MKLGTPHLGMGVRIGIGFVVVLGLMVALSAIGLRYVAEANQHLKNIAENNNIKIELATEMQSALRERALAMHALPILADPFDKDAEIQRFNAQGAKYVQARDRLKGMPLSKKESEILTRILDLTREAQPEVQAVVEMSTFNDNQAEIFDRIRNVAMPRQRAIAEQVGVLLDMHDMQLPASIHALLAETGISPRKLTLEITESAVMANPNDGLAILTELDRMGVTLAIDDFGTGYSSLGYLKRLPVDELKIDKSFVMDMEENENDAVIVRSTIDLAHNLGLKVTAEGVETQDAWDTLGMLGCDYSQGFFMGRPMPAEKLETWLEESAWSRISKGALYVV